jgi:hypothetical protein
LETEVLPAILSAKDDEGNVILEESARGVMIDMAKMMFNSERWEDRFGGVNATILFIQNFYHLNKDGYLDSVLTDYVWNNVRSERIPKLMVDPEFRVRNQVGPLLKNMILKDTQKGTLHFERLRDMLLKNIEETFQREPEGGVDASANPNVANKTLSGGKQIQIHKDETGKTMHDTEGWKSLETSMRIMQNVIEAVGVNLYEFDLSRILGCIIKGVDHINRFVREISYFVIGAIFIASSQVLKNTATENVNFQQHKDRFKAFCTDLIPIVAKGLADNWSQVRYAASQACRSFYLIAKEDPQLREEFDPILVPRMCLNRYYVAEGVKIYSNETWRLVHEDKGKEVIAKYAKEVCKFYISQSLADNHAVREASCHCIGELCTKVAKIDPEPFKPYVQDLLTALLDCFKDASWPVRDCACIACASFVITFPKESEGVFEELKKLWFDHLSDNIQTVRDNSAVSIARLLQSDLKDRVAGEIRDYVKANLMMAKEQPAQSKQFANLKNETQFGVAKPKETHNHSPTDEEHSDKQLYSCGSLAPKLKRGGGCMDHGFSRPKEPWEQTDGSVFLLREVSGLDDFKDLVKENLDNLSSLSFIDHFKHSHHLRENIFKSLLVIIKNIGKKEFRPFIELFLDPVFRAAKDQANQNMAVQAQDLVIEWEQVYGEGIFKGILENHDERFIEDLKKFKQENVRPKDFHYQPPSTPPINLGMGMGSGMGPVAGFINPASGSYETVMTKAPWAK